MINNNTLTVPYIYEGVIRRVADSDDEITYTRYSVLVKFQDGSETLMSDVLEMCAFGGLNDYVSKRARSYKDDDSAPEEELYNRDFRIRNVGDRVIVAFIGGDYIRPVIIGHLPHPKRKHTYPEPDIDLPQGKASYLGMEVEVNTLGETTITHRGAPAISADGSREPEEIEDTPPREFPERTEEGFEPKQPYLPELNQISKSFIENGIKVNTYTKEDGVVHPDSKVTTQTGWLKKGQWYTVDSEDQQVFIDPDTKTITLTNGKDTIQIDKTSKTIFFNSSGNIETSSTADSVSATGGNKYDSVVGDKIQKTVGDTFDLIEGGTNRETVGNHNEKILGSWKLQSEGEFFQIQMKSKNTIYLDDREGKESIFLIHNSGSQISLTQQGNILLSTSDGSSVALSSENSQITLLTKSGAFVSVNKNVLISDASGKQIISMTDQNIEVSASGEVIVSCESVNLNSGSVALGANASLSVALWEPLAAWLDVHVHPTPTGPSAPPLIPVASLKATPADPGSKYIKARINI